MKQNVVSRGFASDPAGRVHGVPHSPKCIGAALNSVPWTTTSFLFWKLACLQTINISDTVAYAFFSQRLRFLYLQWGTREYLSECCLPELRLIWTVTVREHFVTSWGQRTNVKQTWPLMIDWLIDWLIGLNLFRCLTLTFMTTKCTTSAVEKFKAFKEGITVKLDANPGHSLTWLFSVWLPWYSLLFYCPVWALSGNSRSFVANMFSGLSAYRKLFRMYKLINTKIIFTRATLC